MLDGKLKSYGTELPNLVNFPQDTGQLTNGSLCVVNDVLYKWNSGGTDHGPTQKFWQQMLSRDDTALYIPAMGEAAFDTNAVATVISTINTYTRVAPVVGTLYTGHSFDLPTACRLRYIGSPEIHIHAGCTFSIKGAAPNDIVRAILYKNGGVNGNNEFTSGTALTWGSTQQKLGGAGDILSTAIHVMTHLQTNDYLELAIKNLSSTGDFTVTDLNIFAMGFPANG